MKIQEIEGKINLRPISFGLIFFSFFYLGQISVAQAKEIKKSRHVALKGIVREKGTRKPLGGVNIFLLPLKGQKESSLRGETAISDEKGEFSFKKIEPGRYKISALLINYKKYGPEEIVLTEGKEAEVSLFLEKGLITMLEIVVETESGERKEIGRRRVRKEEAKKVAGSGGDLLKVVENFPGVATSNELSGDLYVRGSGPFDNIYLLDKMFISYPYHLGGFFSNINTDLVKTLDFYAGGFGVKYIDILGGMGGVIDISTREPRTDRLGGKLELATGLSSLTMEGPLFKKSSFYLSGRRSYLDFFIPRTDKFTLIPIFHDYQGKFVYNLSERNELSMLFFGSGDDIKYSSTERNRKDPELSSASTSFDLNFDTQGIRLKSLLTPEITSDLVLSQAVANQHFILGKDLFLKVGYQETRFREELLLDFHPHKITTGLGAGKGWWKVRGRFSRPPREGEPEYNFSEREKILAVGRSNSAWALGAYLEDSLALGSRLQLIPGLQYLYFEPTREKAFITRLALRYKPFEDFILKGAWGRYRQAPRYDEFDPDFGNSGIKSNEAIHYVLGLEKEFTPAIDLDIQAYYKDFRHLVVSSLNPSEVYCNCGKGLARGVEFFLRHKLKERFFGWLSYSYSVSKRKDREDLPWRMFTQDQTHLITLVANYQLTAKWNIGLKWRYSTGSLYTPIEDKIYDLDSDYFIPLYGEVNSLRLPPSHRLDLRFERKVSYNLWILSWYLEIWNVYYHANPVTAVYNADYSEVKIFRFLPLFALAGVSAEF